METALTALLWIVVGAVGLSIIIALALSVFVFKKIGEELKHDDFFKNGFK